MTPAFGLSLALQTAEREVGVTMPSPKHFLLEDLLLELGKQRHHLLQSGTIERGKIRGAETGRRQEGDGVGQWHA